MRLLGAAYDGFGRADVPIVLQAPGNAADAVPCERLPAKRLCRRRETGIAVFINLDILKGSTVLEPAIVVIDMLEDAVKPFSLDIVPPINRLTEWARKHCLPVIFAMDSFLHGDFIFGGKMKEHCIRGTKGAQVMQPLEQKDQDLYVPKRRFSAFFKTDLDQTLRLYQIDTVAITGINTHWCVLNTVFDALAHDFRAYMIEDCCSSFDPRAHDTVLEVYRKNPLNPLFKICNSDALISEYESGHHTNP